MTKVLEALGHLDPWSPSPADEFLHLSLPDSAPLPLLPATPRWAPAPLPYLILTLRPFCSDDEGLIRPVSIPRRAGAAVANAPEPIPPLLTDLRSSCHYVACQWRNGELHSILYRLKMCVDGQQSLGRLYDFAAGDDLAADDAVDGAGVDTSVPYSSACTFDAPPLRSSSHAGLVGAPG